MRTIFLIARDSIRALLHRRLLLGLMVATLAATLAFSAMFSSMKSNMNESFMDQYGDDLKGGNSKISETDRRNMRAQMEMASTGFQTFFYVVASFGGSLVALFIFSDAVTSEIRRGTIRLTLSKPVSRTQFLLGKYLGGVAVMAGYALLASGAMLAFAYSQQFELSPAMQFAPWLMFCRQLMLGSVAMLLSLFCHPLVAAVIAFFAGNGFYSRYNPLYYILPSYGEFDLWSEVFSGTLLRASDVGFLTLYAADFVAIMLLLAIWRFRTNELI
jgi:ABC-type transport system involved in multi-copper enzyme maturation permease subunit